MNKIPFLLSSSSSMQHWTEIDWLLHNPSLIFVSNYEMFAWYHGKGYVLQLLDAESVVNQFKYPRGIISLSGYETRVY